MIATGAMWTIALSVIALVSGTISGTLVALAVTSRNIIVVILTQLFVRIFQGTPLLLQLFVIYFGVALLHIPIGQWAAVAIGFCLHAAAFIGAILGGGIKAVPRGQTEAANVLGLGYIHRIIFIILPQAFRITTPALVGFAVTLVKGTSLASIIGFTELTRAGQLVSASTFQPLIVYGMVGGIYFLLCWPLSTWGQGLEKRMARSAR
ncbi:amino acid ABC transporter permease [Mesorhizobium sp. SB112]|uniref:amino acid ABC transporter permease n=1 Tax=Mesorhizobium sp. SB112 TaxID=3151853 RepID=UPI00326372D8